jgi:hypothetical protein
MKNKLNIAAAILAVPSLCLAGVKAEEQIIPGLKLRIDSECYLTDKNGVAIPEQIIGVAVGKLVALYRTDGFCYHGQVTEIEEGADFYKVYGKILNCEDSGFGFALHKGGFFSGAIRERQANITYVLEYSPAHKGFVFIRSYKHDKPLAGSKNNNQKYHANNHILEWLLNTKV